MITWTVAVALAQTPPGPCLSETSAVTARPSRPLQLVSAIRPLKVHYRPGEGALATAILGAAEHAWAEQVDRMGFPAPVLPDAADGPEFDIYLSPIGPWEAHVVADDYIDTDPADGLSATSSFMEVDRNLPMLLVDSYIAHEFNHATQYASDFREWSYPLWEGTATASQHWTLGTAGAWAYDVGAFQSIPWMSTMLGNGYAAQWALGYGRWGMYEYGAALWVMHLDAVMGPGDGTWGALLWSTAAQEGGPNEPDVVDAFATLGGGGDLGVALNGLARSRVLVGSDWDPRGIPQANLWPVAWKVPAAPLEAADLPVAHALSPPLLPSGQGFIELDLSAVAGAGAIDPWLVVDVSAAGGQHAALTVLTWASDGTVGEVTDPGPLAPYVELPVSGLDRVVIGVSSLGPAGWDGDQVWIPPGDHVVSLAFEERG